MIMNVIMVAVVVPAVASFLISICRKIDLSHHYCLRRTC
jgi:hypothetical protein